MRNKKTFIGVLAGSLLLTGGAFAAAVSHDVDFLKEAATGDLAEIQMGQLAADRGKAKEIRDLGNQIATDHKNNLTKAGSLLKQMGQPVPTEATKADLDEYHRISRMEPDAFDAEFQRTEMRRHQKMIPNFKEMSEKAKDPKVRDFAAQTLPDLNHHLDMAKEIHNPTPVVPRTPDHTAVPNIHTP